MASPLSVSVLSQRMKAAIWGIFIADALSMPVHWYYSTEALDRDFGRIETYQAPKSKHPTCIMNLANTGGGGRGGQSGSVVGDVILKGKKHLWGKDSLHYHVGMSAGENTLNALCARLTMRAINKNNGMYDKKTFLEDYIVFMTTANTHNDTYAESYHRDFFANWAKGVPPERCAGKEGHDTPSIGAFVSLPLIVFQVSVMHVPREKSLHLSEADTVAQALVHMRLTHQSRSLEKYASSYVRLLRRLILRPAVSDKTMDDKEVVKYLNDAMCEVGVATQIQRALETNLADRRVVGGTFSTACYISDSYPSILFLAAKYHHTFEDALLANTNCGGENCHRGSALGALVGSIRGMEAVPPLLVSGLVAENELREEIDEFVNKATAKMSANVKL